MGMEGPNEANAEGLKATLEKCITKLGLKIKSKERKVTFRHSNFKAWVRCFLFFSPNDSPSETMKNAFYFT